MTVTPFKTETSSRSARMLRTALGPGIAAWLKDAGVVEVMLNPDGRLWVDRLADGLSDTGAVLSPADGERIIRLVAHHVGAEVHPVVSNIFRTFGFQATLAPWVWSANSGFMFMYLRVDHWVPAM